MIGGGWHGRINLINDLHACRFCGAAVVNYRGRKGEPMDAANLYHRHVCDDERSALGVGAALREIIECACGVLVVRWDDGTKENWPDLTEHDRAAHLAGIAAVEKKKAADEAAREAKYDALMPQRRARSIDDVA